MAVEMGLQPTPLTIARHYSGVIRGLMYDERDSDARVELADLGIESVRTQTVMRSDRDRRRLAEAVLAFGESLVSIRAR
jgi:hypothetical protein